MAIKRKPPRVKTFRRYTLYFIQNQKQVTLSLQYSTFLTFLLQSLENLYDNFYKFISLFFQKKLTTFFTYILYTIQVFLLLSSSNNTEVIYN